MSFAAFVLAALAASKQALWSFLCI